jgi:UDP-N-acetylglucosamine--N-acetylmuramyl-(pentapeptide) pyrophosphoryl-undecaprenol N-acetylglucosamine transferase
MKLVIAGGGTGGHLFPALALVEEFKRRDESTEIIFIGGRRGLEEKVVPEYGYELELLDVESLKKRQGLNRLRAIYKAVKGTFKALGILRRIRPDGVIGSGSYSSGPVVLAARLLGVKTVILEQNALPGLTNRLLGRIVDRVYTAFEQAGEYFPPGRTVLAGNPIRRGIMEVEEEKAPNGKFNLLVFGGSQGATTINAAFLDATEYLTDIWNSLRVIHQAGMEGYGAAEAAYRRKGLKVELHRFIDDMASAYASADLVVCRAGATSIAEITALGIAAILVPYPFSTDDHQEVNARHLAERGAAVMIKQEELTGSTLAGTIRKFFEDRAELERVKASVKLLGRPDAAQTIVDDYTKLLEKG